MGKIFTYKPIHVYDNINTINENPEKKMQLQEILHKFQSRSDFI